MLWNSLRSSAFDFAVIDVLLKLTNNPSPLITQTLASNATAVKKKITKSSMTR